MPRKKITQKRGALRGVPAPAAAQSIAASIIGARWNIENLTISSGGESTQQTGLSIWGADGSRLAVVTLDRAGAAFAAEVLLRISREISQPAQAVAPNN